MRLRERIAQELDAADQHDRVAALCEREVEQLAEREAAGEFDAAAAEKLLDEIAAKAKRARDGAAHRRRVAAKLDEALTAETLRTEIREFQRALESRDAAARKAQQRGDKVAKLIEQLAKECAALEHDRQVVGEALALAHDRQPTGVEFPPTDFDEAAWSADVGALIEFLHRGPQRPAEQAREAAETAARQQAASGSTLVDQALRDVLDCGDFRRLERLPQVLQVQAAARVGAAASAIPANTPRVEAALSRRVAAVKALASEPAADELELVEG